jgi:hypothetical protein
MRVRIDGVVNNKGVVTGVIKSLPGGTTNVTGSADTVNYPAYVF